MNKIIILIILLLFNTILLSNYSIEHIDTIMLFSEKLPSKFDNIRYNKTNNKYFIADKFLNNIYVFDNRNNLIHFFFSKPYLHTKSNLTKNDINLIHKTKLNIIKDKFSSTLSFFKVTDDYVFTGYMEQNNKYYIYIFNHYGQFKTHIALNEEKVIDIYYLSENEFYLITYNNETYYFKQFINNNEAAVFIPEYSKSIFPTKIFIDKNNIYLGYNNNSLKRFDYSGRQRMIFFRNFTDFFDSAKTDTESFYNSFSLIPIKLSFFNNNFYLFDSADNKWKKNIHDTAEQDVFSKLLNSLNVKNINNNYFIDNNIIYKFQNNTTIEIAPIIENNLFKFIGLNKNNHQYYFIRNDISGYYNTDIHFNSIEIFDDNKKIKTLKNLFWNDNERIKDLQKIHITDEGFIIFLFYNHIELYDYNGNYINSKIFDNVLFDIISNFNDVYLLLHNNTILQLKINKINNPDYYYMANKNIASPLNGFAYAPAYSNDNNNLFFSARLEDSNNDGQITFEDKISIYNLKLDFTEYNNITDDFRWYGEPTPNPDNTKLLYIQLNFHQTEFRNTSLLMMDISGLNKVTLFNSSGIISDLTWLDNNSIIFLNTVNNKSNLVFMDIVTGNRKVLKEFEKKAIGLEKNISGNNFILLFDEKLNYNNGTFETPVYIEQEEKTEKVVIHSSNILSSGELKIRPETQPVYISETAPIISNAHSFSINLINDSIVISYINPLNNSDFLIRDVKYISNNEVIFLPLQNNNFSNLFYWNLLTDEIHLIKSFPFYIDEFNVSPNKSNIIITADLFNKRLLLQYNLIKQNQSIPRRLSAGRGTIRTNQFDNSNFKIFSLFSTDIYLSNFTGSFYIDNLTEGFDQLFIIKDDYETTEVLNILISPYAITNFGNIEAVSLDYPIYNEILNYYMENIFTDYINRKPLIETFITNENLQINYSKYKNELFIINALFNEIDLEILPLLSYEYLSKLPENILIDFINQSNFYNFNYKFINKYMTLSYVILNFENIIKENNIDLLKLFLKNDNLDNIYFNYISNNLKYIINKPNFNKFFEYDKTPENKLNITLPYHLHKMKHRFISTEELNQLNIERQLRY